MAERIGARQFMLDNQAFLAIEAKLAMLEDDASLNVRRYLKRAWGRALLVGQVLLLLLICHLLLRYEDRIKGIR